MKTLTAEQFKKKYGDTSLSTFDTSKSVGRNVISEAFSSVVRVPKNIMESYDAGIAKAGQGLKQIFDNPASGKDSKFSEVGRGVLNLGGGLLETAFSPVTGAVKSASEAPGISDTLGLVKNKVINPASDAISNIKALQEFAVNNPNAEEIFSNGLNIILSIYGGKKAPELKGKGKTAITPETPPAPPAPPSVPEPVRIPTTEVSAGIMDRVARLKPTDATKFSKMSGGKTPGQYLTEKGNFGAPDKIISNEAVTFTQSKNLVDNELAKLPGVYKDGSITDALNGLVEKAKNVSSENVRAPYLSQVLDFVQKYNSGGLTMAEINMVKRLYESKVKLGYNKLINGDKVELATNIDNSLRNWQIQKAKDLGFKNITDLNKQTQLSRFIIDKLGDQVVGQGGLNSIGLTDWIVLSGGNPNAVAGFLTKKFFSSRAVQAKVAEMLNIGEPVKGLIQPDVLPTVENTLRGQFPEGVPLMLPEGTTKVPIGTNPINLRGASSMEAPAKNIAPTRTYNPKDKKYYEKGKYGGGN